jgi:hypothetical protein
MEQPAVKQKLGESYPVVTEAFNRMEAEMEQLVQVSAPSANVATLRKVVVSWADEHPIQASLGGRPSMDAERIRKLGESDLGTMASIKALGESLGDLTARLDSYNSFLPKQARWQAELLLSDLVQGPAFHAASSNFATVSNALAKTSDSMEKMPELVEQARNAVDGQRLAMQDFLREERVQAFSLLRQERIALMSGISREEQAATADLRAERQIVLQALHDGRMAVLSDMRAAEEKAAQDFDSRARGLMKVFFWRALGLMLLTLFLCLLAAWFLLHRFAGKRPDRGQVLYDRAA